MKNILKKQREVIAIFIFVVFIVGLFYFAILPLIKRIDEKNNQIQEETIKQQSASKQISDLPKMEQQYNLLQNGSGDILLDKERAVTLIEKLEKLAESTDNKITIKVSQESVSVQKVSAKGKAKVDESLMGDLPGADYLKMNIALNGGYNSIMNFVRMLEKFEYYGDVVSIQIVKSSESSSSQQQSFSNGDALLNPFEGNANEKREKTIQQNPADMLQASLETVFYTK